MTLVTPSQKNHLPWVAGEVQEALAGVHDGAVGLLWVGKHKGLRQFHERLKQAGWQARSCHRP